MKRIFPGTSNRYQWTCSGTILLVECHVSTEREAVFPGVYAVAKERVQIFTSTPMGGGRR